jgi:hypothetical protein
MFSFYGALAKVLLQRYGSGKALKKIKVYDTIKFVIF